VFSKPEIRKLFAPYELVQLYTDIVPNEFYSPEARARFGSSTDRQEQDAKVNYEFQRKIFNDAKLPLYAILEPRLDNTIRVVGVYKEGKINREGDFIQFLREPIVNASSGPVAQAGGR
jgi:hypothetical protein